MLLTTSLYKDFLVAPGSTIAELTSQSSCRNAFEPHDCVIAATTLVTHGCATCHNSLLERHLLVMKAVILQSFCCDYVLQRYIRVGSLTQTSAHFCTLNADNHSKFTDVE